MKFMLFSIMVLLSISCNKENGKESVPALILLNQAYGPDPRQTLDVYLPASRNSSDTKLLILIHGGGWVEGDKADFTGFVSELQRRFPNYSIANINYRLYANNQNKFPTQENDVKAAIEFLVNKSVEYKISKQIAILGASAGGHLALLYGYKYNNPVKAKAIVSFFGPSELVSLYDSTPSPEIKLVLANIAGGSPATNPSIYQQSSPLMFVNAQSPPTILLHGGKDPLVPASQSELVKNKLGLNNVPNEYIFYPTEGHGWVGVSLLNSIDRIEIFLDKYF